MIVDDITLCWMWRMVEDVLSDAAAFQPHPISSLPVVNLENNFYQINKFIRFFALFLFTEYCAMFWLV